MNSKERQLYPGFRICSPSSELVNGHKDSHKATCCSSTVSVPQVLLSLRTGLTSLGAQQRESAATVSTEMGEKKAEVSRGLKDRIDKQS